MQEKSKHNQFFNLPAPAIALIAFIGTFSLIWGFTSTVVRFSSATDGALAPKLSTFGVGTKHVCQYPNCNNTAKQEFMYEAYSMAFDQTLAIDNSADFKIETDSFTYTPTKKHTAYDKGTYLVPQDDGSLKFENRTYKYEYETKGKSKEYTFVNVSGYYCGEHAVLARESFLKELKDQFVSKNPMFWIMCVAIPVLCIGIIVIALLINKKASKQVIDKQQTQGEQ